MKKKIVILVFVFFKSYISFAQNPNQFVEVTVSDTVLVEGSNFLLRLMVAPVDFMTEPQVAPARDPEFYRIRETEMREMRKTMLATIEMRLGQAGFKSLPPNIMDMMSGRDYGNHYLVYRINSVDSMIRFQNLIKEDKNVMSVLQSVSSKNEELHQRRLYLKIMEKARARAEYLALISGKKITGLLSVSEQNRPDMGNWRYRTTPITEHEGPTGTAYPIYSNLVIKFGWN